MGKEMSCSASYQSKTSEGMAYLESTELRFRGEFRIVIPLNRVSAAVAKDGVLTVWFGDEQAAFRLGAEASQWADKVLHPPTRIDKLGIKAGSKVVLLGVSERGFEDEVRQVAESVYLKASAQDVDCVIVEMASESQLKRLVTLEKRLASGGAIWVVWPKGRPQFKEDHIREFGRSHGLVDVKVMRFSDGLSALKLVRARS